MSETIELVRFSVHPDRRDEFLRDRPGAIAALREAFPGLIEARLAELEDGTWIDVVRWRSKAEAETAAAECSTIPVVRDWMATIAEVQEFTHATVRDAVPA
jgi:hypothetical protein